MAYSLKYSYDSASQTYSVTGWSNITTDDNVVIPSTYDDGINGEHPVTSIRADAFNGCSSLTSVTIPNSVTSIGNSAFYNCRRLTSVTIPNSVISIGFSAFSDCRSLTSVYITDIAAWCKISFGNYSANPLCWAHNLYLNNELVTELTIPNSVTSIGNSAFYGCSRLTSVTIGNSVTSIGNSAFYNCRRLTSVTIPNSVISIGFSAFNGCSSLTSVTIPDRVTSIGSKAFYGCSSLTSVTIPDSVTSIGDSAFNGCSSLTSVTIPNSVTSIGNSAFNGCSSLTSVYITDIAAWCKITFGNDSANPLCWAHNLYLNNELVTELIIPDSVTSIGDYAFSFCSSLTSVTIPNSVTTIGNNAFAFCSSLKRITIPDSVTIINPKAFYYCQSLTSITVDENNASYKSIDGNLYNKDVTNLIQYAVGKTEKTFTIPNSVTTVSQDVFNGCNNLMTLTIPDSVATISEGAFYNCSSLTTVMIGNGVKSIGFQAFYGCIKIKTIILFTETPPTLSSDAIPSTVSSIYVLQSAKANYKTATNWTSFADKLISNNLYLSFVQFNIKNKEYIDQKLVQAKDYVDKETSRAKTAESINAENISKNTSSIEDIKRLIPETAETAVETAKAYTDNSAASSLEFVIDNSTFILTATLKNAKGEVLGTPQTVDLPLESVVVNGSYDGATKSIILTLQNGSTVNIPVADLIDGLASKAELDKKIDKLTPDSTYPVVPITYTNGTEASYRVTPDAVSDTIPNRDSNGNIKVSTPIDSTDAANKDYVDNNLSAVENYVDNNLPAVISDDMVDSLF